MRTCNIIMVEYWKNVQGKGLTAQEILVEFYLITNPNCGPSGAQIAAESTIAYYTNLDAVDVRYALGGLEIKERIVTAPGDWILVCGKWEYESTKTEQVLKAAIKELKLAPEAIQDTFTRLYQETIGEGLDTLCPKGKGKGKQKDKTPRSDKPSGQQAVARWCELHEEIFNVKFIVTPVLAKHIKNAFLALKSDLPEFERRVRLCFADPWYAEHRPGPPHFYRNINRYAQEPVVVDEHMPRSLG